MAVLPVPEVAARERWHNWNNLKKFFFSILLLIFCTQINAQKSLVSLLHKFNSGEVPYISVQELRMYQLDDKVTILDARETEEFQVSHLENAIFVGYDNFDGSELKSIPKDQKIVVYCSVGIRSENIADKIIAAGFTNVQNLYGGIFKWKNEELPVVDSTGTETEKIHVYSKHWSEWLKEGEKIY